MWAQVLQFTREVEVLRKLVREGTYGRPLDAVFQRPVRPSRSGPRAAWRL